jgi:hypothetical protein
MNHYQTNILFTDNHGRSMDVFIEFDEVEPTPEDAFEERAISLAYKQLMEMGFNEHPDDHDFLFFNKITSITLSKYL